MVPRTARRCGSYQNYIDQLCNNATAERRHTCGQLTCPRAVTQCAEWSPRGGIVTWVDYEVVRYVLYLEGLTLRCIVYIVSLSCDSRGYAQTLHKLSETLSWWRFGGLVDRLTTDNGNVNQYLQTPTTYLKILKGTIISKINVFLYLRHFVLSWPAFKVVVLYPTHPLTRGSNSSI